MIESVDALSFLVGLGLAAVVWFLRSTVAPAYASTARVDGHARHDRPVRDTAPREQRQAPGVGEEAAALGPYADLAAQVDRLSHSFKLLQNEWLDKESRVDALVKRLHRLNKIAQTPPADEPEAPPPPSTLSAADQRAEILRRHRNGGV